MINLTAKGVIKIQLRKFNVSSINKYFYLHFPFTFYFLGSKTPKIAMDVNL